MTDLQVEWWVLQAQLGDRAAFARLVDGHDRRLRYFVRQLVGGRADADDVTQETWLAVLRQIHRLREPASFVPWLYQIGRNQAWLHLRRRMANEKPQQLTETAEPDQIAAEESESPFKAEDAAAIHEALKHLPAEQREVFVLRLIEDLSYEELAAALGVGVGTVRSRLHYAKRALRSRLQGEPP